MTQDSFNQTDPSIAPPEDRPRREPDPTATDATPGPQEPGGVGPTGDRQPVPDGPEPAPGIPNDPQRMTGAYVPDPACVSVTPSGVSAPTPPGYEVLGVLGRGG